MRLMKMTLNYSPKIREYINGCLPPKDFREKALLAVEQAKDKYDIEQLQRKRAK